MNMWVGGCCTAYGVLQEGAEGLIQNLYGKSTYGNDFLRPNLNLYASSNAGPVGSKETQQSDMETIGYCSRSPQSETKSAKDCTNKTSRGLEQKLGVGLN